MNNTKKFAVIWLIVFATMLVSFAVVVKPTGEIHTSVLTMTAELLGTALTFAGLSTFAKDHGETKKD